MMLAGIVGYGSKDMNCYEYRAIKSFKIQRMCDVKSKMRLTSESSEVAPSPPAPLPQQAEGEGSQSSFG